MKKFIYLLIWFAFFASIEFLPAQNVDSLNKSKQYNYELNWGFTSSKALKPSKFEFFPGKLNLFLRGIEKYNPLKNRYSLKFGVANQEHKVQVGYYLFSSVFKKYDTDVQRFRFNANGIEFLYNYLKLKRESKILRFSPFLSYRFDVGTYDGISHTIHGVGVGGEFDIKLYKGFYLRNNTSINYFSDGFPMFLISQFYFGYEF